ncbi:hypothetical protein BRC93_10860 [Halobacteriales archaeon QS_5_70_15]|nr:MAG: hypothetical protein BRC93_10860 [Halobacteriales archaeon QS_5_70_15]
MYASCPTRPSTAPHTTSYVLHAASLRTRVVGGGGIVGPSSAYYLVERGAAVTSVEVTDVLLRDGVVAGVGTTGDPSTPRSW